jgi:hypothetical protein
MTKRINLRIYEAEEAEIQIEDIENKFNGVIEDYFPNLKENKDIHVQEVFKTPNNRTRKKLLHITV